MSPRKILPLDVLGTLFQAKPIRPKTARRDPPLCIRMKIATQPQQNCHP